METTTLFVLGVIGVFVAGILYWNYKNSGEPDTVVLDPDTNKPVEDEVVKDVLTVIEESPTVAVVPDVPPMVSAPPLEPVKKMARKAKAKVPTVKKPRKKKQ